MKYLIEVFTDDPGEPPYEEWAESETAMNQVVNRITSMLRDGDTVYVTDQDAGEVVQERRKVAA